MGKVDTHEQLMREIKQTGYLNHRYTKPDTMSKEWGYYINLEGIENSDIEFRYCKGRIHGDILEKLGLLEDILEHITIPQLLSFVRAKSKEK